MGLQEKLVKIEGKSAWSFFGFILAIIFGAIAVYTTFLEDKNPNLQFVAENSTQVLDLKENIKNLDILYKGINIKEQDKNLSIVTLKIINNSNVNILKSFYDEISPIQILIENAEIVDKPQIINTSNEYLEQNLKIELDSTGCIYLPKIILEGNEFFTISLLLLHKNGVQPTIKSAGKIAGQIAGIPVLENYSAKIESSFWDRLIQGSVWIHIVRFLLYLVSIILGVLSIVIPVTSISESIQENRKKKRVKNYKKKKEIENTQETDAVFDLYLKHSEEFLKEIQKLIAERRRLRATMWRIERNTERFEKQKRHYALQNEELILEERIGPNSRRFLQHFPDTELIAMKLKDLGMIKLEGRDLSVNETFEKELIDFNSYLKLI